MAKISERAVATIQRPASENRPDYIVRARQGKNSRFFQSIGFAWRKTDRNGNELISVKINSQPIDWDGSVLLVLPFVQEQDTEE